MNTNIIELREKNNITQKTDATHTLNGSFQVDLHSKNIVLNNNDNIQIKSLFLDTTAQNTGKIRIDNNNNEFSISNCMYLTNFRKDTDAGRTLRYDDTLPSYEQLNPNGKFYTLCNRQTTPIPAGYVGLLRMENDTSLGFEKGIIAQGTNQMGEKFGGFSIKYGWLNPQNKLSTVVVSFDQVSPDDSGNEATFVQGFYNGDIIFFSKGNNVGQNHIDLYEIPVPNDTKTFPTPEMRGKRPYNCKGVIGFDVISDSIGDKFSPAVFTTKFNLPIGDYSPQSLAETITDNLSNIKMFPEGETPLEKLNETFPPVVIPAKYGGTGANDTIVFGSRSNFCSSTKQLLYDDFFGFETPDTLWFVSADGESVLDFEGLKADNNYLVGSSEISLEYIDEIDKFQFTQLHTSQFNSSAMPVVKYFGTDEKDFFLSSSVGGVFFTELNPPDIWYGTMGFDSSVVVLPDKAVLRASMGYTEIQNALVPSFSSLERGINITSDFNGVDAVIIKEVFAGGTDLTKQTGSDIIREAGAIAVAQVDGTATIGIQSIRANTSFGDTTLREGYYLVQIEGLPNQELTNMPSQHIQAIVSKYYSAGSFTIMEGSAGSFNYTHKGNPFYIQSLRVRILEADGTDPTNLGDNNTIFLQIERANVNDNF